jgi:hypothetical protein
MVSYTWGKNIMKKHFLSITNHPSCVGALVGASSLRVHFHDIPLTHYSYKVQTRAHYSRGFPTILVLGAPPFSWRYETRNGSLLQAKICMRRPPKCVMGSNKMCLGRRYVWQDTKVYYGQHENMSGHHPSFWEKEDELGQGKTKGKKEANNSFVLAAIRTHC